MFVKVRLAFSIVLLALVTLFLSAHAAVAAPSITSLTPSSGAVGATITIAGSGFGSTQGTSTVKFNGTTATVCGTCWTATSITVVVPTGATLGNVIVTVSGVASNGKSFTVLPTPTITSISPTSGPAGITVTIIGTNFGSSQGSGTVKFNGASATVCGTCWTATSIQATVPTTASTGSVIVHTSGVDTNGKTFTFLHTPNITSLSPSSGPVGTTVTIAGTNFGSTQGTSTIKFNGTTATPCGTCWTATSITVVVPLGATPGNVVVTVSGVVSNGKTFTVTTLSSIAVTPSNPALQSGNTLQFTATGTYSDSSTQNLTTTATWTSSFLTVATINGSGSATGVSSGTTTIQAAIGAVKGSSLLTVPGFVATGNLNTARWAHTSTQLNNGLVLIAGGEDSGGNSLASAELYNPATGAFSATANLNSSRLGHTATLLTNGMVLIAGGYSASGGSTTPLVSAELYDPVAGTFTTTGGLVATARIDSTATLLGNGRVLIAGGADALGNSLASAEIYDLASGSFTSTPTMNFQRTFPTATLLNNGKVLVTGGFDNSNNVLSSAELFDPATGIFTTINPMTTARFTHVATLLNSGLVLLAGGYDLNNNTLASAELYDPVAGTFTVTGSLSQGRGTPTTTLLVNGKVLLVGGTNQGVNVTDAELYDPAVGTFSVTNTPIAGRYIQTATLLNNGTVLVAGGASASGTVFASAELYQPATMIPVNLVTIAVSPANPSIPAGTAQTFVATGTFSDSTTQILSSAKWTSSNTAVATVSNDSTDHGILSTLTKGSTTLSGCAGTICGSTNVTVVVSDPEIVSLSPSSGPAGAQFTITGTGFGAIQGTSTVTLNQSAAIIQSWSPAGIVALVPNDLTGNISVHVGGITSNLVGFTVIPTPSITGVSPTSGDIGATIQITGSNFGDNQLGSTVSLNGAPITVVQWSASAITATIPGGATPGNIVVMVSNVLSNPVSFAVTNVPAIFSLSPMVGPAGTVVAISGADFGSLAGCTVTFNGILASVTWISSTSLTAVVPTGAATGPVVVTVAGVPSNGVVFGSPGSPNISSLYPNAGLVGSTVTITGTDFGVSPGSVSFDGTTAVSTSWSTTQIVVTVPANAKSGNVSVTASGVTGTAAYFTVLGAPVITSISNYAAAVNAPVTITGNGFGGVPGSSTVTVNGVQATTTTWTATSIVLQMPAGAATGPVIVSVLGVPSNGIVLHAAPVINTISPLPTVIGNSVTLSGMNFSSASTNGPNAVVWFESATDGEQNCATTATSTNDISIVVVVPACVDSGPVSLEYTTAPGYGAYSNVFNITVSPSITGLSPMSGTVTTLVQINGGPFGYTAGTVMLGSQQITPTAWAPDFITFYPPLGAVSGNIVVTANGKATNPSAFTFITGPEITGLSVTSGQIGSTVTISGSGFGSSTGTVTFNGTPVVSPIWSAGSITVTVPTSATPGNVVVTSSTGVASNGINFTVLFPPTITSLSQPTGSVGGYFAVYGNNFGNGSGGSTVTLHGNAVTIYSWSPNTIWAILPANASSGNVVVTVPGLPASSGFAFTVVASATIASVSPSPAIVGTSVTVTGTGFTSPTNTNSITFNGASAIISSSTGTTISTTVPEGASTGPIVVTTNNGPTVGFPFTVPPGGTITGLAPTKGGVGAQVTITGVGFGPSPVNNTVKFNGTQATILTWSDTSILASVPNATTGLVIVAVGGGNSNGINFTVTGVSLTSLSPSTGNTGVPIVITGTGFGTSPTGNKITFNGVTATSTAWSNTSITVPVPAAATTGPVVVTVGGAPSDPVNFTIQPKITTISPEPAAQTANITIMGENFGATQGLITCNGNPPNVQSWTLSTIVISCQTNLGSNSVQVTVNGVASAVVEFDGIPTATTWKVYPQMAPVGATVKVTGKNFGSSQGQSTLTVNGVAASPTGWSDGLIVFPVPAGASGYGPLNIVVAGASAWPAIYFTVGTYPVPHSVRITPSGVNMLIGDVKQFTAIDELGHLRQDAAWSVDNATLGTLGTGSSPTLTALAAGTITLTATVQGVSVQSQVAISGLSSFSPGTVLWSAPPVPGFTPQGIIQAVPTDYGPDVYSFGKNSDGSLSLVQAVTSDGQVMWETELQPLTTKGIPDGFGGYIGIGACNSVYPLSVIDLDGGSGLQLWKATLAPPSGNGIVCPAGVPKIAIRQDAAVVIANPLQVSPALILLDWKSGNALSAPPIPPSTSTDFSGHVTSCDCLTPVGQPIVDSDGSIYLEYELREIPYPATTISSTLWLLKIGLDGVTTTTTQLSSSNNANLFPGNIIPDGQGGVLATWTIANLNAPPAPQPYQAARISSAGVITSNYALPMAPTQLTNGADGLPINPVLVLGENSTAFASYGVNLTSFDPTVGSGKWNYQASLTTSVKIINSDSDNSIFTRVTDNGGIDTITLLDPTGNVSGTTTGIQNGTPWGNAHWLGQIPGTGALAMFYGPFVNLAAVWPAENGGLAPTNAAEGEGDFELVWCANGGCLDLPDNDKDVPWNIIADDAPHNTITLTDAQKQIIQQYAFSAFTKAFLSHKNIQVTATIGVGRTAQHTIYVVATSRPGSVVGGTEPGKEVWSRLFYPNNVAEAQRAVNATNGIPTQALLQAIGTGIGYNAAHEIGHQLVSRFLSSGKVVAGMGLDDSSVDTINGAVSAGDKAPWLYTGFGNDGVHTGLTAIHWENVAEETLTNIFGN